MDQIPTKFYKEAASFTQSKDINLWVKFSRFPEEYKIPKKTIVIEWLENQSQKLNLFHFYP